MQTIAAPVATPPLLPEPTPMLGKPVYNLPAKTVLNLHSQFKEKLLCDGLTFSAGTACAYSCAYCYVDSMMHKNGAVQAALAASGKAFEDIVIRRANAPTLLRNQLYLANGKPRFADPNDRRVVYASPLVDVAANLTLVRETIELCTLILQATSWHIRLLSKSTFLPRIAVALEAYRDRMIYGVSTGTLDDATAKAIEPNSPYVSKRLESLHWLQDQGFRTYGMVCPTLPLPKAEYGKSASTMLKALRADRLEHVWAEVINLRGASFTRTVQALQEAGCKVEAKRVTKISSNGDAWETYARDTFLSYAGLLPVGKLRFLQYVTKDAAPWWSERKNLGAIPLGAYAGH